MGKSKGKGRKGKPKRRAPPFQAINNFVPEAGKVRRTFCFRPCEPPLTSAASCVRWRMHGW